MKDNFITEIISEFTVDVPGLNHVVKGRIEKTILENDRYPYSFTLSHYCKGTETASTPYYPSTESSTYEDAKDLLLVHLKSFTTIGVVQNEKY